MIQDRIVVGVCNHQLSEKMQLDPELTLEKATNQARQSEAVKTQQITLRISHEEKVDRVVMPLENNESQRKRKDNTVLFQFTNKQKVFSKCGYRLHQKDKYPARKAACNKRRKIGHYARLCRRPATLQEVTTVETAFLGTVSTLEVERRKVKVDVRDFSITFKVGTGADVTVVPDRIYRDVFKNVFCRVLRRS